MQKKIISLSILLRNISFCLFLILSLICLIAKISVVQSLDHSITIFSFIDIIRSESSVYLAISICLGILFFSEPAKRKYASINLLISITSTLYLLTLIFFMLKLSAMYSYTRDATPFSALAYGAHLFTIRGINADSAFIIFSILCPSVFLIFWGLAVNLEYRASRFKYFIDACILILIFFTFLPPQQNQIASSITYNPLIFTLLSSHQSEKQFQQTELEQTISNQRSPDHSKPKQVGPDQATNIPAADNSPDTPPNKNIVLVILESTRFDAISTFKKSHSLSPRKEVSPNIAALSQNAIVAKRAFATIPHTSKALVAIHCGITPFLEEYLLESSLGIPTDCLATQLGRHGYQSAFFQSPTDSFENRRALVEKLGFQQFLSLENMDTKGFDKVNYFGYEDDVMLKPSHNWLTGIQAQANKTQSENKKPFIATYLTGTSHHPYTLPLDVDKQDFHHNAKINRYLNSIYYVDRFVGELIAQYKSLGLYHNTLFILVGDHGEGFGEHKPLLHNNNLFNDGLHIPLIFHSADLQKIHLEQVKSQTDILQIALTLATNQITLKPNPIDALRDIKQNPNKFASCWYKDYCYALIREEITPQVNGLTSKIENQHKTYKYLLNIADKQEALFDIDEDPFEKNNLIKSLPELARSMSKELLKQRKASIKLYEQFYYPEKEYEELKDRAILNSFTKFQAPL